MIRGTTVSPQRLWSLSLSFTGVSVHKWSFPGFSLRLTESVVLHRERKTGSKSDQPLQTHLSEARKRCQTTKQNSKQRWACERCVWQEGYSLLPSECQWTMERISLNLTEIFGWFCSITKSALPSPYSIQDKVSSQEEWFPEPFRLFPLLCIGTGKSEAWRAVPEPACWAMPSVASGTAQAEHLGPGKGSSLSPQQLQQCPFHCYPTPASDLSFSAPHGNGRAWWLSSRGGGAKAGSAPQTGFEGAEENASIARESHVQISRANEETKEHRH